MKYSDREPIAIVGGGPAGLTAAAFLRQHNVPFIVYEAGKQVAGLAASFHDSDGFTYDFGAHFITNRLAAAVGVGAHCRDVNYYGESVLINGETYSYPFGLLKHPRYLMSGLTSRLSPANSARANSSAAEWFRANYGHALANDVAIPLLEAWSGAPATELAASVGDKLQNTIAQTLRLKAASNLTGRAVGCGYSHEVPENPNVWHVYPEGGVGLLCQRLASGIEDAIRLESPVEEILVESGRVRAVKVKGREQPVSAVVSTAPCHILAEIVKGTDALKPFSRFRYRPMTFVNMRFEGRAYLPDTVLWVPESEFLFFRLTETPLSMPWLAPEGKTLITVDIGCEVGDDIWRMDDESLGKLCLEQLKPIIPSASRKYLGCRVLRTPIAYPVFLNEYEADRQRLTQSTGVEGLYSIGRNGEFSHSLMEDVYWRTQRKMLDLLTPTPQPALSLI
ncbi:MAG: FAD-dependent oxidoreductase [Oculatellaceae cyanobacterium Prado106]|jgi:protoporphyrinogen oxidase|nr:FAD-dependent oxidoreductase [Oculatellaceae cyanobacterium Prado106]